jgi:hypothetical protein
MSMQQCVAQAPVEASVLPQRRRTYRAGCKLAACNKAQQPHLPAAWRVSQAAPVVAAAQSARQSIMIQSMKSDHSGYIRRAGSDSHECLSDPPLAGVRNFKHCLTLCSKFFSSFPHGTLFAIGLSHCILGFGWRVAPTRLGAAFPSSSTRRKHVASGDTLQAAHGLVTLCERGLPTYLDLRRALPTQST